MLAVSLGTSPHLGVLWSPGAQLVDPAAVGSAFHISRFSDTSAGYGAPDLFEAAIQLDPGSERQALQALLESYKAGLAANRVTQISEIVMIAGKLSLNIDRQLTDTALDWAKGVAQDPKRGDDIYAVARLASNLPVIDKEGWGAVLSIALERQSSDALLATRLGTLAVEIAPSQKQMVVETLFKFGSTGLSGSILNLDFTATLFGAAVGLDASQRARAADLVWDEFDRRLQDRRKLGSTDFNRFWEIGNRFDVPDRFKTGTLLLADALHKYISGAKPQALQQLVELDRQRKGHWEGRVAAEILSLPAPGERLYETKPFPFMREGVILSLVKATIRSDGFSLTFRVRTSGNKFWLDYGRDTWAPSVLNGHCEKLFIVDDNGQKFEALNGFRGGRQSEINSCATEIEIAASSQLDITADFPMLSRGATTVKLVSTQHDGHQAAWGWDNIQLKAGPFD